MYKIKITMLQMKDYSLGCIFFNFSRRTYRLKKHNIVHRMQVMMKMRKIMHIIFMVTQTMVVTMMLVTLKNMIKKEVMAMIIMKHSMIKMLMLMAMKNMKRMENLIRKNLIVVQVNLFCVYFNNIIYVSE